MSDTTNQKHEWVCGYCGKVDLWDEPPPADLQTAPGAAGHKYACAECDKALRGDDEEDGQ